MPTPKATSGSDLSGVNHAELRIRRKSDSPVETLVVQNGKHFRDGNACPPFDFWAEHDGASRVVSLRLRHNVPRSQP